MSTDPVILCVNCGSSSLKLAVYRLSAHSEVSVYEGAIEGTAMVAKMFDALAERRLPAPDAVGHRIVHGGPQHRQAERIDDSTLASLRRATGFAPLHLPIEIEAIEAVRQRFPSLPQVACYDTAFHRDLPEIAQRLPLPREIHDRGVMRYGFHGLSYEYIVEKLGSGLGRRSIILHLGSGSSMVALRDGKPIDTTMGLTPSGGIMMGTRTGDLDPGVIFHLVGLGFSVSDIEKMVNGDSGLLGVSGCTSDMKLLLEHQGDAAARMAVEMYCYQAKKAIGSFAAALGGLDDLIFTGGIGEHAAPVRARICEGLEHLGIVLDAPRNLTAGDPISGSGSRCRVRVVATNEQLTIARQTRRVLFAG